MTVLKDKLHLIISDSYRLLAEACQNLLQDEFDVLALGGNSQKLVETTLALEPDGVIIGISLTQFDGLYAAEQIKRKLPETKLIFLSSSSQPELAAEAFRRGASGYVHKASGAEEFLSGIRTVMRGESYLSPTISCGTIECLLFRHQQPVSPGQITLRQRETLQLLAKGWSMKQVADQLGITPRTVAAHKYNMMAQLGIKSNAELFRFAFSKQMIPGQQRQTKLDQPVAKIISHDREADQLGPVNAIRVNDVAAEIMVVT